MTTAQVKLPRKLVPIFAPPRGSLRYRCAYGGRGSGKSFNFAKMAAVMGYAEKLRILCTREFQVSIKESFHAELKNAIASEPWLAAAYDVGIDYIRGHNGTEFIFRGLRHNMGSIKSMAQIDICVIEEAEDVPEASWIDLEPTIRAPKSEIWVVWNPRTDGSPVDKRFIKATPPRSRIVEMNYGDNPFFPQELEELRQQQLRTFGSEVYSHIWEGKYLVNSDAQVFEKKFKVEEFTPGKDWHGPYYGIDWGFSTDPTAGVKCWIYDNCLFIEYEAGKVGLENDDIAKFFIERLPGIERHTSYSDSARPETISHVRQPRHGRMALPNMRGVKKWPGSVEDGIFHMKSYRSIIIHPRCTETRGEFVKYSYKRDKLSGDVLTDIVDAHNHYIDATRYALSPMIRQTNLIFQAM